MLDLKIEKPVNDLQLVFIMFSAIKRAIQITARSKSSVAFTVINDSSPLIKAMMGCNSSGNAVRNLFLKKVIFS